MLSHPLYLGPLQCQTLQQLIVSFPFFQICHLKLPQGWINGSLQTCSLALLFRSDFPHAARLRLLEPSHGQGPRPPWPGWQAASHTRWQQRQTGTLALELSVGC